jgi:hypothetical protein
MPEVLEKLQAMYKQTIHFNREDINQNYFTGSFSVKDSLSTILKMISIISELEISNEGKIIRIGKPATEKHQVNVTAQQDNFKDTSYQTVIADKTVREEISDKPDSIALIQAEPEIQEMIVVNKEETRYTRISLPALFQELEKQSKKKIHFNSEDLKNINFTGAVPYDASIHQILSAICSSNGLALTVKKGSFFIKKAEQ